MADAGDAVTQLFSYVCDRCGKQSEPAEREPIDWGSAWVGASVHGPYAIGGTHYQLCAECLAVAEAAMVA